METTAATTLENQAQSLVFTHEQLQLQNTEAQKIDKIRDQGLLESNQQTVNARFT